MHKIFVVLLLIPVGVFGQLDRIRTEMTEAEFKAEFPEAKRDLDAEAVWVNDAATIHGVEGNSLWRIYNDTVSVYRFNSTKAEGPSAQYQKFDSAAVHKLRMAADQITAEFTRALGKPTNLWSQPYHAVNDGGKTALNPNVAYLAMWLFGVDDMIKVMVSTDLSPGNFINAPGKYTVAESEYYELSIEVSHRTAYTKEKYSLGDDDDAFFKSHMNCYTQVPVNRNHIYIISDSATSENAQWEFTFKGEMLLYFSYKAYLGTGYGSESADEAYHKGGSKTDLLLKHRNEKRGNATEQVYNKPVVYKPHDANLTYNVSYVHAVWTTPRGNIVLDFTEFGGGKSPEPVFYVQVHYEFTP